MRKLNYSPSQSKNNSKINELCKMLIILKSNEDHNASKFVEFLDDLDKHTSHNGICLFESHPQSEVYDDPNDIKQATTKPNLI